MIKDDDAWMAWFIKKYDDLDDPDLRADLLTHHGIHPQVLASARRRLARRTQTSHTEQRTTPPVSPAPRTSRATRRPTTPRRVGRPRTYQVTRTRRIRTTGRTVTITTTTVTVTTVITVTTNS
ncbi:hypothetical protein [Streptomyces atroolivaceus]|uniref:hypothetical protein n=1 Tax=Streptomyces atroolivaceus TaxID=66869 RepID=UPI003627B759